MSDYNPLGVQGLIRPSRPSRPERPSRFPVLTDYERELQPIYQQEMEQEQSKRNWMRPLQMALDLLQRGQYVSANVADSIIEWAQGKPEEERQSIWEAVTTGLTGKVKGSYENVIRDTLGVGRTKLFQNAPEGTKRAQWDWASVLGLAGDILLDPTTYMTFGGATKGATRAAGEFADDAVRLYLRQLASDPRTLGELTRGKILPQQVTGALSKGADAIADLAKKGGDLSKVISDTYQAAYRQGLRASQENLIKMSREAMQEIGEPYGGWAEIGLENIAARINAGSAYKDAGETFAARFMTKELGVGPERGVAKLRRNTWDRFENLFKSSKIGSAVSDGIWGLMHNGPIGEIRRTLGFRDPYQKYLRAKELNALKTADIAQVEYAQELLQPLRDLSDDELSSLYRLMGKREDIAEKVVGSLETPSQRVLGIVSEDPKLAKVAEELETSLRRMKAREDFISQRLGENVADARRYYLPKIEKYRSAGQNVRRQRQYTFSQSFDREVELTKFIYGVDDDLAKQLVEANATGLGTDIREAMVERAMIHSRAEGRWALFEQIKEMGIDLRNTMDPAADALRTRGREIKEMGMETINHPALDGFVFDREVAKIADRAIDISGKGKNVFQQLMAKYANWWKGMVLATSGYHARNFMTNTMIQFLHHGPRAFNKDEIMKSAAAVWYVLKKSNPKVDLDKFLTEVGLNESHMAKLLNMPAGNMTVRELAEEGWRRNVISQSTMGYDARSVLDAFEGKTGQPLRTASRAVGNYVENIPRFQSFMIDYMDNAADAAKITRENLLELEKPALDFASLEAKKYFLDYEDLTAFERDTLKNIIPFYTFLRKNLGAQLSAMTLYPEMYSLIPKVEEFFTYDDPNYDPTMVPEWMRNEGMFAIRKAEEGFRFFRPDFAYNDINLIPLQWDQGDWLPHFNGQELKDQLINATAPWIRRTVDFMMDSENAYNFFYQSDLGPTSDAPYLMRLFASRPEVVPFVDGLLKMAGYKNGAHIDVEDGKLRIDSRMALVLEEFLPVIRQASFLFYLVDDVPFVENIIENHLMVEDEYEGAEKVLQSLSFFLGVKMRDQDLETERQRLETDIYYQARDILSQMRRQEPGADIRRQNYYNQVSESIRRIR